MTTVKLDYPIDILGATVRELMVQRVSTVEDLIIAGGDLDDDEIHLRVAANLTGIAPQDFERLDFEDIERVNDAIAALGKKAKVPFKKTLRRPNGRDILDLKKDWNAPGLVSVVAPLSDSTGEEFTGLEASVFIAQVNKLMGFLGRRGKR